jgi:hypothetical protein
MRLAIPLALIAAAWTGLRLGIDPVPTWFYVFVWYPTLVLLDDLAHRIDGRARLLSRGTRIVSLFAWSAVIWLVFEAANFRLANWYYVFLPKHPVERWAGILLSFATVVPAIVLMTRLLDAIGGARRLRTSPLALPERQTWVPVALGGVILGLTLAWPRTFFPLVWGAVWLLLEPFVYRRRPELSLFADLTRGEWERVTRLFVAGFLVGALWEFYNFWARGRWIYTVPWLENVKLFEMPPVGFVGFPFFALEAWTMYAALVSVGVAVPVQMRYVSGGQQWAAAGRRHPARLCPPLPASHAITIAAACVFSIATLLGMERWTISSVVPTLDDLPRAGRYADQVRAAGIDSPFELAVTPEVQLAQHPDIGPSRAVMLTETAKLATLRGLGAEHARRLQNSGVFTPCRLAVEDPLKLWQRYHRQLGAVPPMTATPPIRPTPAEVRVWVTAAQRACRREGGQGE